jgi:hypothetical protein
LFGLCFTGLCAIDQLPTLRHSHTTTVAHKNEMLVEVKETLNSLRKEHVKASIRVEEQSKEIDMLRHHVRFILLHSGTTPVGPWAVHVH